MKFVLVIFLFLHISFSAMAQDKGESDFLEYTVLPNQQKLYGGQTYEEITYEDLGRKIIRIGKTSYSAHKVLEDFFNVAVSNVVWGMGASGGYSPYGLPKYIGGYRSFDSSTVKERLPWIYPFIYYPDGVPRFKVLNKWTKPITVSVQYPNDLESVNDAWETDIPYQDREKNCAFCPPYTQDDPRLEVVIQDQVVKLAPVLNELTGLPVSFIPQKEENENKIANIRIVYENRIGGSYTNLFKKDGELQREVAISNGRNYRPSFEHYFNTIGFSRSVPFTPEQRAQVEGHFFSNQNNEIQFAICHVWRRHSELMIRALVTECLVRALGLPNVSAAEGAHILAPWNTVHQPYAKRKMYDGADYDSSTYKLSSEKDLVVNASMDEQDIEALTTFVNALSAQAELPSSLSEYDKTLIKILYSPDIQPGWGGLKAYSPVVEVIFNEY